MSLPKAARSPHTVGGRAHGTSAGREPLLAVAVRRLGVGRALTGDAASHDLGMRAVRCGSGPFVAVRGQYCALVDFG